MASTEAGSKPKTSWAGAPAWSMGLRPEWQIVPGKCGEFPRGAFA